MKCPFCEFTGDPSQLGAHLASHPEGAQFVIDLLKQEQVKAEANAKRLGQAVHDLAHFRSSIACGTRWESAMDTIIELLGSEEDQRIARREHIAKAPEPDGFHHWYPQS